MAMCVQKVLLYCAIPQSQAFGNVWASPLEIEKTHLLILMPHRRWRQQCGIPTSRAQCGSTSPSQCWRARLWEGDWGFQKGLTKFWDLIPWIYVHDELTNAPLGDKFWQVPHSSSEAVWHVLNKCQKVSPWNNQKSFWRISLCWCWDLISYSLFEAAQVKHLVPVVWRVAKDMLSEDDPYEKHILGALAGSASMEEVLDECKGDFVLRPAKAAQFARSCQTLNISLSQLGLLTHAKIVALWNFTIKNHILEHIAMDSSEMSPWLCWNYGSESLLMHVRTLVMANKTQPSVHAVQLKVMANWLHGFELSLKPSLLR